MLTVRDDGSTTAELPPRAAVAIHVGLRPAAEP
jgi:hypothetical protein